MSHEPSKDPRRERLVWVDLEMTGLDPDVATIVEIATLVTDGALEVVAEGPELIIHASEKDLAKMQPFVVEMHTRSGLLEKIRASQVTLADAERQTAEFLASQVEKGTAPLAGNSVWKDKQFLERYMPAVMAELHYRIIDVSTVKELTRRWYPGVSAPKKQELHRAMDDIRESIAELKFYRANVFR